MNNSNAHLQGQLPRFNLQVTKMSDGRFKASGHGHEAFHDDQAAAVNKLTEKLHEAVLTGQLRPGT